MSLLERNAFELLQHFDIAAVFRSESSHLWDETLQRLSYVPVSYTQAFMDYQLAYFDTDAAWADVSLILTNSGVPCGVWPLRIARPPNGTGITSYGFPLLPPIFVQEVTAKIKKNLATKCLKYADALAKMVEVSSWQGVSSFGGVSELGLSIWHRTAMQYGASVEVRHELFADLGQGLGDYKRNLRKSYKSLISAGIKDWQIDVLRGRDENIWSEFRLLHLEVAGRQTRARKTWDAQHQAIVNGDAFLIYLRNDEGRMVGGGLFSFSRDEASYDVGVYDRNLFNKPLGHVVQFRAVEEMMSRGIKWYRIGDRPFPNENPLATKKQLTNALFKQGFATHLMPKYIFTHGQITRE